LAVWTAMAEQCEKARGVRESRLGSEDAEDAAHL
jgi:hypothetical protein